MSSSLRSLHGAGGISALCYGILVWISSDSLYISISLFLSIMAVLWGAYIVAFIASDKSATHEVLRVILLWGLVFRAIAFFAQPIYEDDHYRYLWDGRTLVETGNPYAHAPEDFFGARGVTDEFQEILDNINHPEIPTIYGPVSQYAFGFSYLIAKAKLYPLKLLLLIADLATLWCLSRLTVSSNLILYAWCPLLLKETIITAHIDSLGIALLVAACYFYRNHQALLTGIFCGLAISAKVFAVLIVPFLLFRSRIVSWLSFSLTLLICYLPFAFKPGHAGFDVTRDFASLWEFNSSLVGILSLLLPFSLAKQLASLAFVVCYGIYFLWFMRDKEQISLPQGDWVFGLFFLLAPVVNPWYLLWMLPFVVINPSFWGVTTLAAVTLSYVNGTFVPSLGLPSYHHPSWLRPLEYGVIAISLGIGYWMQRNASSCPLRLKDGVTE